VPPQWHLGCAMRLALATIGNSTPQVKVHPGLLALTVVPLAGAMTTSPLAVAGTGSLHVRIEVVVNHRVCTHSKADPMFKAARMVVGLHPNVADLLILIGIRAVGTRRSSVMHAASLGTLRLTAICSQWPSFWIKTRGYLGQHERQAGIGMAAALAGRTG
jgi:hypothetical protein